jgi:cytochrome d ubiquinol oxidase subunit II
VLGGADLGAGLWDLTAGDTPRGARLRGLVQRSMSPVWEANHVWSVFVLVVLWTAFPTFFASVMSTLYLPLFGAALGIVLRGFAFALRGEAGTIAEARVLGRLFATSSVLVPFCLGAAVGGIVSGRVPPGNAAGAPFGSWLNPSSLLIGTLAVLIGAYLAAVYLAADAARLDLPDLVDACRGRALAAGALAGATAVAGLLVLRSDAPLLYDGLTTGAGLVAVLATLGLGAASWALVRRRALEPARWISAAAVGCLILGWALAQRPYLLPGMLTLRDGSAGEATLSALLVGVAIGGLFLVPSLLLLFRLVLRGRLGPRLEPLGQRFHPFAADES